MPGSFASAGVHIVPRQRRTDLQSTNTIERLIRAMVFGQGHKWQNSSSYMMVEAFAKIETDETALTLSTRIEAR